MKEVKKEVVNFKLSEGLNLKINVNEEKIIIEREEGLDLDVNQLYAWLISIDLPVDLDGLTFVVKMPNGVIYDEEALIISIKRVGEIEYYPFNYLKVWKNNKLALRVEFPQSQ